MSFDLEDHRDTLATKHWSAGKTGPVIEKREANIGWIKDLPRSDLEHEGRERQIRLKETEDGEHLFIQYPGKEATREDDGNRPWDFRPRLQLEDGTYGENLSFGDVWDTLFYVLEELEDDGIDPARALAILFYRMAFMVDHRWEYEPEFMTRVVSDGRVLETSTERYPHLLVYDPPQDVISDLSEMIPEIGGMSLEAFLHYNDLLAWNEDCKYYYRDEVVRDDGWDGVRTGRINNLLTHVSIIGIITGDYRLSDLLNKFQRSRGVAPVTRDEAELISNGILG